MRWNTRILLLGCLIGLLQTSAAVALLVQPPEQHHPAATTYAAAHIDTEPLVRANHRLGPAPRPPHRAAR